MKCSAERSPLSRGYEDVTIALLMTQHFKCVLGTSVITSLSQSLPVKRSSQSEPSACAEETQSLVLFHHSAGMWRHTACSTIPWKGLQAETAQKITGKLTSTVCFTCSSNPAVPVSQTRDTIHSLPTSHMCNITSMQVLILQSVCPHWSFYSLDCFRFSFSRAFACILLKSNTNLVALCNYDVFNATLPKLDITTILQ